jgi:hypothetical protein
MKITPTRVTIQTGLNKKAGHATKVASLLFSRVQAKDVVRGSRRRMAMKTSLAVTETSPVRRIEIGTMLRGRLYNTNRVGYLVR